MTGKKKKPRSGRLVQWFGANTENASLAGALLDGCDFVAIPFSGGMSEVPHIAARQVLCNDRHRHVINLCQVVADDAGRAWLMSEADKMPFHPDVLAHAQKMAATLEWGREPSAEAALWFFLASWMNRGGKTGTDAEFSGGLAVRRDGEGGGSNQRFRTAIVTLEEFGQAFRRCEFTCEDALQFIANLKDKPGSGLYVDAPWPETGGHYIHKFTEQDQRNLAASLDRFKQVRVVVRFGIHPLIEALYPRNTWFWRMAESRTQANTRAPEIYLLRNCEDAAKAS